MRRAFEELLSKVGLMLQGVMVRISSRVRSVVSILDLEEESSESTRVFYLLSLMLLISLIVLSPDKLVQTFSPIQADSGIIEKAQEITKIAKKLIADTVRA